ncbi:MAG: hypothetical protein RUMPE_00742 [Eubacteriales bacterium SKADARSKE-1]|nr:hypothetical protein [Eubacteriales bacterium SKADARSKE-1]
MFKSIKKLNKNSVKSFLVFTITISFIIWFFFSTKFVSVGAKFGLKLCLSTLVPSLFPFMVLSSLIVNLGFCKRLSFILGPITKFLFKLPGVTGATILLGFIGGYPTGANGIMTLLKNNLITNQQAEQMAYFVVGAGPSFVITFVGSQLLHNEHLGVILFVSQVISSILIGIGIAIFSNKETIDRRSSNKETNYSFSQGLIISTSDSVYSTINMCAFVVLFSSLLEVIKNSKINIFLEHFFLSFGIQKETFQLILSMLLEVTNGMVKGVSCHIPIFLLSFAMAWAGICVHLQIFYCLKGLKFSKCKFMLFRLLQGVISGIIAHILVCFFTSTTQVCNIKIYAAGDMFFSVSWSSFALILLSLCFLSTITLSNVSFSDYKLKNKV